MDLTPYLDNLKGSELDEVLLSVAASGKMALWDITPTGARPCAPGNSPTVRSPNNWW